MRKMDWRLVVGSWNGMFVTEMREGVWLGGWRDFPESLSLLESMSQGAPLGAEKLER